MLISISTSAPMGPHQPSLIASVRWRRTWLGTPGRRLYLAYVEGQPAAQAMLYWSGEIAYLESAGTLPAFRGLGLHRALIQRRIADAMALGCRLVIGAAEFASQSFTNQIGCGLSVAYTANLDRRTGSTEDRSHGGASRRRRGRCRARSRAIRAAPRA